MSISLCTPSPSISDGDDGGSVGGDDESALEDEDSQDRNTISDTSGPPAHQT